AARPEGSYSDRLLLEVKLRKAARVRKVRLRFMETLNNINVIPKRPKAGGFLNTLFPQDKDRPSAPSSKTFETTLETNAEANERAYADLKFLKSNVDDPFAVRLARELPDAVGAVRQDPSAFISAATKGGTSLDAQRKKLRAGITVAVAFYTLALSGIYVSYRIFHRVTPDAAPVQHLAITFLAPPPVPVKKAVPQLKEAGGTTGRGQLAPPIKSTDQPKAEFPEAKPTPRPPDQTVTTEPITPTSNSPTSETASRPPASDCAARGLSGSGGGKASGGPGSGSNADVNYNGVFTISNVTTRPQMLSRPVPGYTEEARRAQIEGQVKLSAVLNANGTISDIRV